MSPFNLHFLKWLLSSHTLLSGLLVVRKKKKGKQSLFVSDALALRNKPEQAGSPHKGRLESSWQGALSLGWTGTKHSLTVWLGVTLGSGAWLQQNVLAHHIKSVKLISIPLILGFCLHLLVNLALFYNCLNAV